MARILFFLTLLAFTVTFTETANILVAIPFSVKSHYIMQRPIGLELARRGHNVTVITAFKETEYPPNYHEVVIEDVKIWDMLGGERPNLFTLLESSVIELFTKVGMYGGINFSEFTLSSKNVQTFLAQNNTFDLVITEQFYMESLNILAHKYSAPLVLISTFRTCAKHNVAIRNPLQIWALPYDIGTIKEPASLLGRLKTSFLLICEYVIWYLWYLRQHENLAEKYIPDLPHPVPSLYDVQRNVSLTLINSHISFNSPVAYLPNVIEVGGIHLQGFNNNDSLPKDLQAVLDKAEHGVVYVNFGSNIKSSELPDDVRNVYLRVFGKLQQTVIWKWENDTLENKPENLVVRKWLPQAKILAHPNVKVFVSHGGLMGTIEAIHYGVPVIGIPIFADQFNNLLQMEYVGTGKIMSYYDVNEDNLERMLNEFLEKESYKQKALELSRRFKDRPMSALDTAIFWIEYVIRHKGADHLKNPAIKLNLMAYYMIDVILCYVLAAAIVLYLVSKVYYVCRYLLNFCMESNYNVNFYKKNK